MTLSFSKNNIEKRGFAHRIWASLLSEEVVENKYHSEYLKLCIEKTGKIWEGDSKIEFAKHHTIRADKKNRWKVGNDIHFVMNNRQPTRFQFAPVVKVKAIQKIKIEYRTQDDDIYKGNTINVLIDDVLFYHSGLGIGDDDIFDLSISDGFDSVEDFFKYFDSDFEGKIIHWSKYKY